MKLFKKIDLFYNGNYWYSTNQSRTCKEAREKCLNSANYYKTYQGIIGQRVIKNPKLLKARFNKLGGMTPELSKDLGWNDK